MTMSEGGFPAGFLWGAATAAYQIEGAVREDGRGPSIWDTFSHIPGRVLHDQNGDIACDHYHRWPEDIALMREIGLSAYRFSIAWPRVQPEGRGQVNRAGIDFYDRLVDGLLEAGIRPFATLYHWDLPQALQDRGGWLARDTAKRFSDYAAIVAQRLGDRVTHWITQNEPYTATFLGHYRGVNAPGLRDLPTAIQVAHHLLLSHGRAAQALRATRGDCQIGISLDLSPVHPASDSEADAEVAEQMDIHLNRWFLDPIFGRGYPTEFETLRSLLDDAIPGTTLAADLQEIAAPLDFLGVNYYASKFSRRVPVEDEPLGFEAIGPDELAARGFEITGIGWPVIPHGLHDLLMRVHRDYAPPAIYVTENGAAFHDEVIDGAVNDPRRIAYLDAHLQAVHDAIGDGAPVKGYFVWSLMDNFEWDLGFSQRFGIVYVDYDTQQRIPKASAVWYQRLCAENALPG
ncbi:MAG TPA: GH1 family beta-glucosidase [Thermomicrobiaceae bacterium]|nr:GH1 family beta-glucosidase [Thermomicrobiaceae bacterium]